MEESPHSTQAITGKLQELLTDSDNDTGLFCFKEEMIEKVMQEFYKEIACSPLPKPPSPTPTPLPSLSPSPSPSPSYSVADSASKSIMMAGAEAVSSSGGKVGMPGTENGPLSQVVELQGGSDEFVGFGVGEEKKMEQGLGCEVGEDFIFDDEWLARVLSWGQGQDQDQGQVGDTNEWF